MPTEMTKHLLAFTVLGTRLGLETSFVKEVLPAMQLLVPPETPPLLLGFLRLRGALIPVIRLELLVQGSHGDQTLRPPMQLTDRLMVVRLNGMDTAWLAAPDMQPLSYHPHETAPLPPDHLLNNCAQAILPGSPPVILLEPELLLLATEKQRLEELQKMELRRLEQAGAPAVKPK